MNISVSFDTACKEYLIFCKTRKNLDYKTLKAYSIDLKQFADFISKYSIIWYEKKTIEFFIKQISERYKPKTVKRKIASLKAFFRYLEIEEILDKNPFHKIQVKYKEPFLLPKTIPLNVIEDLIRHSYQEQYKSKTLYSQKTALRDTLILELLFATGMRISELCSLTKECVDLSDFVIKINGKGSKERLIQICNRNVQSLMQKYYLLYQNEITEKDYFFINRFRNRLSSQSVRNMIKKCAVEADISLHITPHMFRHSFATLLLEEDVDIRYIQQMLGHSSITTTQIYTHTSISKQKTILAAKHPRNRILN